MGCYDKRACLRGPVRGSREGVHLRRERMPADPNPERGERVDETHRGQAASQLTCRFCPVR